MTRALRVGVDARPLLDASPRGEGRAGLNLYRALGSVAPDWRVTFYGDRPGAGAVAGLPGVGVRRLALPGFRWNTWMRVGLPAAALRDRVDVLHCTSSEAPGWAPCPVVVTVHDLIPLLFDDGASPRAVSMFRRGIENAVGHAAAIVAVSESTKRDLVRVVGADPAKVHVIHWGVEPAPPRPSTEAVAQAHAALGLTQTYLLAFGGGAPRKNVAGTLRGFARIARERADLDLVVVGMGRGAHREAAQALVASMGLTGRVHLLDYVSDAQLEAVFADARALLYLSHYEGFGLPVLEAMSRGVPVLASNRSSLPEVSGDAALLVDPDDEQGWADRALDLLADETKRAELVRLGRARAGDFSWPRCASQTAALLRIAARS